MLSCSSTTDVGAVLVCHIYLTQVAAIHLNDISGGSPRNLLLVKEQLEDYRTVIAYARRYDSFDPKKIVLWGSSFSGGHVIKLASEARRAVPC